MNVALVHDWVVDIGGAERCLEVFREIWPDALLNTLVYSEKSIVRLGFDPDNVRSSFLQRFPRATRAYRAYLPFYPLAIEQFDLSDAEVIISSSHAAAKGVLTRSDQVHICYCHTPMRYAWDLTFRYLQDNHLEKGVKSSIVRLLFHYMRMWDSLTANRVDYFIANSRYTARRIWRSYRRTASVIYPPVDVKRFRATSDKEDFFLFVSRLVPYKKADLVTVTFTECNLPLRVVGDGPHLDTCRRLAGPNVTFLGYQDDNVVADLMSKARALVFAAEEDFGIVPVEAQACGTPVVALSKGGTLETIIPANGSNWDSATGILFDSHSVASLRNALEQFLQWEDSFLSKVIVAHAQQFSRERFRKEMSEFVEQQYLAISSCDK